MLGYQPWRCMKHNLIANVILKPRWFLNIVWENFVVKNFPFFNVRIVKGPKTNTFTCKWCAWVIFNSWGRASVPRVIAGTRICKLVTRSLVVDGHRVEVNPNSRVRRSIVSEEAHVPRSSVWSNSYKNVHCSLLRLRVFFVTNFLRHG